MRRRSNLYLYLILNVLVSAATTLAVLVIWDRVRGPDIPPETIAAAKTQMASVAEQSAALTPQALPEPTSTNPPPGAPVIQIVSVVGAGDLGHEVVLLKRLGEGNLRMAGWRLAGERGSAYTFPDQPELVLYQGGAVQVFSSTGTDTATEVYWNRAEPAWASGETIRVLDGQGQERAVYTVP